MLQHDNVNMMLLRCMKYNNTLNTTFLHGTITSQTNQTTFITDVTMPAPTTSVSSPTTSVNSQTTTANSPTTMELSDHYGELSDHYGELSDQTDLEPYWSQNMTKTRSNTNQTLRVCFYLFLN